jgi:CRISPR-associated protein Csd1
MNPLSVLYDYAKAHNLDKEAFFEEQEVEFLLQIEKGGGWELRRLQGPRKGRGMPMHLPIPFKRTSGILPNFPADTPAYVLGLELDEKKPDLEWTARCHAEYVRLVRRVADETKDPAVAAAAKVLEKTGAKDFEKASREAGMASGDCICPAVKEEGEWQAISERPSVRKWWTKNYGALQKMEGRTSRCQVTGEELPVARLHPLVTGIKGGRSTGVTFMTWNEPSAESFGREQGENGPVSVEAAILYSKALSRLVSRKSGKRRSFLLQEPDKPPVYMIFVTKKDEEERAADFVLSLLDPLESDIEIEGGGFEKKEIRVWRAHRALFSAPYEGQALPPPDTAVNILSIRPNGARIEVRSYFEAPFDEIYRNIRSYFEDLAVVDSFSGEVRSDFVLRSVWWRPDGPEGKARCKKHGLIDELRDTHGKYPRREVQTALFTAAVQGRPFPPDILRLALAKVCVKSKDPEYGAVPLACAALLKAFLNRESRRPESGLLGRWHCYDSRFQGVREMLDSECKHPAYVNGRIMAVAQRIQEIAIPGVGASVVVKFFDAASKSPGAIMAGVLANMQNHLTKIGRAKPGLAVWCNRTIGEVLALLPAEKDKAFPRALDLQDQGLFALGYHHQRHKLFEKKNGNGEAKPDGGASGE